MRILGWACVLGMVIAGCKGNAPAGGSGGGSGSAATAPSAPTTTAPTAGGSAAVAPAAGSSAAAGSGAGMLAASGSAGDIPTVSATGGLVVAGTTAPTTDIIVSQAALKACQAACDHRATCGLEPAGCVDECSGLFDLGSLTAADLGLYATATCEQVKQVEPQFRVATACRRACAHRVDCVPGTDLKACIPDCSALVIASKQDPAVLAEYINKDCEAAKADEPTLVCLHSCTHVLGCGVAGDLPSCLQYCGSELKKGTTLEQIAAVGTMECEQVKQSIQLPAAEGAGGGGGKLCTAEGIYTVCDGSYCRDRTASTLDTETNAVASCSHHMTQMVLINQMANRASIKQTCHITSCK